MSSAALWVVTSYYNPAGYARRLENYRAFRRCLQAPLIAVELARPGAHQLRDGDADIVVSLTGEDRIWQKERLINIGVDRLPDHVRYVAWVDCDVIFDDGSWVESAKARLDRTGGIAQLFDTAPHLSADVDPREATPELCRRAAPLFTRVAFAQAVRDGLYEDNLRMITRAEAVRGDAGRHYAVIDGSAANGLAWAARRDVIAACGLFDQAVVGGGDSVKIFAAFGGLADFFASRGVVAPRYRAAADAWAGRARAAGLFRDVSAVPTTAYHLWHGEMADRAYLTRNDILNRHDFDPDRDLARANNGTWTWAQPDGALAEDVEAYFLARREDGRARGADEAGWAFGPDARPRRVGTARR